MKYSFNYEWYTVDVIESTGKITWEVKAKDYGKAVEQIKRRASKQNRDADNKDIPWWKRGGYVKEVLWETISSSRKENNMSERELERILQQEEDERKVKEAIEKYLKGAKR